MSILEYVLRVNRIINAGYAESVVAARSREMWLCDVDKSSN